MRGEPGGFPNEHWRGTICQRKQRTVVKFALRDVQKPIGIATYALTDTLRPFSPGREELVRPLDAGAAGWG